MITFDNKLVYSYAKLGDLTDPLISEKFINVQKIIYDDKYYILDNDNIYTNDTLDNDDFKIIESNIKYVDIEIFNSNIYAVGINGNIYVINKYTNKSTCIDINYCECGHIVNILSPKITGGVIKNSNNYYYLMDKYHTTKLLGKFDRIYFFSDVIITVTGSNIQTFYNGSFCELPQQLSQSLTILSNNVDLLYKIPEGSFLRYYGDAIRYDCDRDHDICTSYLTTIANDKLIITIPYGVETFAICYLTGCVFRGNYIGMTEILKLKNCTFSNRLDDTNRFRYTKGAHRITNKITIC
jgi:hypothetical protein